MSDIDHVGRRSIGADPSTGSAPCAPGSTRPTGTPALVLVRHGETEWSRDGRHTGRTDIPLTEAGEQQAAAAGLILRQLLGSSQPAEVISSPRQRAMRTAQLAGFAPQLITEDAAEWDYGDFEGLTSEQIRRQIPHWNIWDGPVPGGESAAQMSARVDRLLADIERGLARAGDRPVLVFSHGHASRCIAARWLGEDVTGGRHYWLGTGAVSSLGFEHDRPVILRWNLDKSVIESPR